MKEFVLIIKKITFVKIWNLVVRNIGIVLSRILRRYVNIGMPWSYSIEPCNICNLKCKECASGQNIIKRRRGQISFDDFCFAVDQIAPFALNLFIYFQGEPTLNKQFPKMVEYANKKGIYTATSTNAHFLTSETCEKIVLSGLGKMIVSLDGFNQNSYESYRVGGNFDTVLQGIKNLSETKKRLNKKTPIIEVQTLVTKINEQNLNTIKDLAIKAGADSHYLKTMQIENDEDFETFKTSIDKYSRYDKDNRLKNPVGFCSRIINSAVVTIDMDVLPCCYDKDANLKMGNMRESSLKKIIKSQQSIQIINTIEQQRDKRPAMCKNCGG